MKSYFLMNEPMHLGILYKKKKKMLDHTAQKIIISKGRFELTFNFCRKYFSTRSNMFHARHPV